MRNIILQLVYPLTLIIVSSLSNHAVADVPAGKSSQSLRNGPSYIWYDGNRQKKIWLNPNLIAEFEPKSDEHHQTKNLAASAVRVNGKQRALRLWRLTSGTTGKAGMQQLSQTIPSGKISPVLHDGPSESSRKRALPGNIIIHLNPDWDRQQVNTWLQEQSLEVVKPLNIGPNIFVVKTGPGLEALEKANAVYLSGQVVAAYPDWWQEVSKR